MQRAMTRIAIECEWRYIGCTERIGHHEFEVSGPVNKYIVIFQQDTYEWNVQLTVEIGYKNSCHKSEQSYDAFLEKLKLAIKNSMVRDWYKCVWISDSQSLWLSREVYSEIYMAENELRAFVSKVMIDNFGAEWHDRPEFSKLSASIELNADNVKRNVPNFANIDVNLYTVTLEGLMDTVQSDIYTDAMSSDSEVQKRIKSKIFSTTQLDKMKSALDFLRNQYTKKYNIWDKFFIPFIDKPEEFQTSLTSFIANRNHVAHNKLLDYSAKEKMLYDTHAFRGYIKEAVRKFDSENRSEEVEETLQAIEDQKEYEREAHLEIVQSEAGISIRDRKKILALFREVIRDIYRDIHEILYFNEVLDVNEINSLKDEMDEQLLFTIFNGRQELLNVYGLVDIDDSEGATSVLKISVVGGNDEDVATESIEYVNGVVCSKRLLNQAVGKSLRTHNLKPKKGAQVMRKNEKITALYERLSRDDFGKDDDQQRESNSISNQKAMLEEFAARQGFTNIVHFTDDGISGTCFDRPGFLAMMKEVEAGNVEYLCIKDMSRMGRDYLKVGQIMEILRQRGVRLIAINDGVDSARGDDDFTPFRNIMNEYYARDTSRKIRSTFQSKGKSGKHLTGTVIYGYLWNEARDQWLVDPEAADVVKRIFAMTIEGYGPYQIASKLKEEKILIPSAYLAQHGEGVNKNKTFKDVYGWGSSTICNILEKREYLGHTINFKTRKHFKDKKSHYVPEDEWTIFENTHEAIIDQQTFDLVQKIRGNVRRYPDGWGEAAPLTGLLYCADCGGKMYVHRTNNGKRISQYTCSQYSKVPVGKLCTTQHRINEDVVLSLVSEMLKAIAEYAKHDRAEFVRVVQEAQSSQQTAEVRKQRTRLATAKQRVSELEVLLCKIYEDNILGKLSDSRYATLDAQYEKEQSELTAEISALEKAVKSYEKHEKDADRFIALIDKYENFDKLTIAMLNEFIEKILVHERDRKGSIQTTQEVEIYFNFVGRFVPPAFGEAELTPEELEEIRKREERKDRLHQNYLKRKASGAQKRYEDKIKKRKKAEIEAKKAAIRAEDIAKGVFVPVSSLPQREPMKGVQTA